MLHRPSSRIALSSGASLVIALALSGCGSASATRGHALETSVSVTPAATDPSGPAEGLDDETRALRARSWAASPNLSAPLEIFAFLHLSDGETREGTPFSWTPRPDVTVSLLTRHDWGTWDTGMEDRPGPELQIRILGLYAGTPPQGSLLLEKNLQLAVSAPSEMSNEHVRAVQRADGTALIAFDSYMLDMDTDVLETNPYHSRRALLFWSETSSRPIVVAEWNGNPAEAPAWARY
jgi:hypothetical protein